MAVTALEKQDSRRMVLISAILICSVTLAACGTSGSSRGARSGAAAGAAVARRPARWGKRGLTPGKTGSHSYFRDFRPGNREILSALMSMHRERNRLSVTRMSWRGGFRRQSDDETLFKPRW